MARRTVYLHLGPTDPGTAFLAPALRARDAELRRLGVRAPAGQWHQIEDQIWKHKGLSLLSCPDAARARADQIALVRAGLRDVEVHLVLIVRDLRHQVHAAWQESLAQGGSTPLHAFAERVLDPARSHWQAEEFWSGRDLAEVLSRWGEAVHPERVHILTPDPGPDAVWAALLEAAGLTGQPDLERPAVLVPPTLPAPLDPAAVDRITGEWTRWIHARGFDHPGRFAGAEAADATGPRSEPDQQDTLAALLTLTSAEVSRLDGELIRLRRENDRLDRKRRKHKRTVAALRADLHGGSDPAA